MRIINAPQILESEIAEKFLHQESWENEFFQKEFYTQGGDKSIKGFIPNKTRSYQERTQIEANGMQKILELQKGEKLLDVPCGAARHISLLSKKGISVFGVEQHPEQIACAPPNIQEKIIQGSMYNLPFPDNHFEGLSNMFFSFGFSEDNKENQKFLHEAFRVLKKAGFSQIEIFSNWNKEQLPFNTPQEMIIVGKK